jgi:transaldolase
MTLSAQRTQHAQCQPAVHTVVAPLRVTLFLDGADLDDMERAVEAGVVEGYTTNPTLVAKAGVPNYRVRAEALARVKGAPISFEVLADDLPTMAAQAREIASWGPNVSVKVPVCTTGASRRWRSCAS